jgi:hypothetical protein
MTAPPGVARSPAVSPRLEYCFCPRTVIVAEAFGESPARSRLRGGGGAGFASRGLYSQSLLARQLALLQLLLAPQQPLLGLQRPLRPPALRLFRLQPLHALLQAIDTFLALHALARKAVALPLLHGLLPLDALLLASFYPLLPRVVGAG